MSDEQAAFTGPDLTRGVPLSELADGTMLAGHAHGQSVLLVRRGDEIFAIGAQCTHYGAPLAEGLLVGDTVRCPWHHACFSLRSGEALTAPALNPVARWDVVRRDGAIHVIHESRVTDGATPPLSRRKPATLAQSVVIIGGGAAGSAAAEMLRREGYEAPITMITADDAAPYDRPNLSKDYLAGTASEEWIPLRSPDFYRDHDIRLMLSRRVVDLDAASRRISLDDGSTLQFDALLLATGAEPVRLLELPRPGLPMHYLRTLADSRAIIAAAQRATRAVVLGASFIGLEVAAALRTRGIEVHVVAPDARPLERVLGPELGDYVRTLHEQRGVVFHLGQTAERIGIDGVTLSGGSFIGADLVIAGIGVRPSVALAERAGLAIDRGVLVSEQLETSVPGIYAAGDIARWPDPLTGDRIRVEHWVVAQRQGQTVARNMLGAGERFTAVPYFWSRHYDSAIQYVGHAERWDQTVTRGDIGAGDGMVALTLAGRTLAVATVGRERASLEAEAAMETTMESGDRSALDALLVGQS